MRSYYGAEDEKATDTSFEPIIFFYEDGGFKENLLIKITYYSDARREKLSPLAGCLYIAPSPRIAVVSI